MAEDPEIELLLSHGEGLRALARSLVLDQNDVDDLIQDAWLVALERRPDLLSSPRGWMARVLRNLAFQLARKRARQREVRLAAEALAGGNLEGFTLERLETHRRLVDLVESLAEPYRGLVMLRYFEGLSPRDIAARLGEKPARVRNRLSRALAQLRQEMDRHDEGRRSWVVALIPLCLGASRRRLSRLALVTTAALLVVVSVVSFAWSRADGDASLVPPPFAARAEEKATAKSSFEPASNEFAREAPPHRSPSVPSKHRRLRGAVTDLEGRPIVDAVVSFAPDELTDPAGLLERGEIRLREPEVMASTVTSSAGRFDMEVERVSRGWLFVRAEGFSMKTAVVERGTAPEMLFTLAPEQWVEGLVVDADGEPLAGVETDVVTPIGDGAHGVVQHVRTDRDGVVRWKLERLGDRDLRHAILERITGGLNAARQEIRLVKPGFVARTVSLARGRRRDEKGRLVLRMSRGRTLTVAFSGPDGAPPADPVPVVLRMLGGEYRAHAETAVDGRFRLTNVPEDDELWLLVDGRQGLPAEVSGARMTRATGLWGTRLSVPKTGDVALSVRLGAGKALDLRVVAAGTRRPLAGREVLCIPSGRWLPLRGQVRRARTDAEGKVTFSGLLDRPYLVRLDDDVWDLSPAVEGAATPPGARVITPGEPGAPPTLLAAQRLGWVAGRVLDAEGSPVAGADVAWVAVANDSGAWPSVGAQRGVRARVTTSSDGSFVLRGVPASAPIRIVAHPRPPLMDTVGPPLTLSPGEQREGLRIAVGRGAALTLELRDAAGRPIAGVGVSLERSSSSPSIGETPPRHGRSDGDGIVVFHGLPDGSFRMAFEDLRDRNVYVERCFRPIVRIEDGRPVHVQVPLRTFTRLPVILVDADGRALVHRLTMAIPEAVDADDRRRVAELVPGAAGTRRGALAETLAHVLAAEAARTNAWGEVEFRLPAGRTYRIVVLDAAHPGRTLASAESVDPKPGGERIRLQLRPASHHLLDELGLTPPLR